MGDPDLPSERWDEDDASLRYPHATRRRALVARTLAAVGILGTLGLAAAAFAPHLSRIATSTRPSPAELGRTTPEQAPGEVPPAVIVQQMPTVAPPPVVAPPVSEPPPVVAPAPVVEPPPVAPPVVESEERSPSAELETLPAARTAAPASTAETQRKASSTRRSRPEASLTPREIERRQQRYELWLRREGLERIH